jgi:hypothetical protein
MCSFSSGVPSYGVAIDHAKIIRKKATKARHQCRRPRPADAPRGSGFTVVGPLSAGVDNETFGTF